MLLQIPLIATPNQQFKITLNGQNVLMSIYLATDVSGENMYCDIEADTVRIVTGAICNNVVPLNTYPTPLNGYIFFFNPSGADIAYVDFGVNAWLFYADYNPYDVYYAKYLKGSLNGTISDIKRTP